MFLSLQESQASSSLARRRNEQGEKHLSRSCGMYQKHFLACSNFPPFDVRRRKSWDSLKAERVGVREPESRIRVRIEEVWTFLPRLKTRTTTKPLETTFAFRAASWSCRPRLRHRARELTRSLACVKYDQWNPPRRLAPRHGNFSGASSAVWSTTTEELHHDDRSPSTLPHPNVWRYWRRSLSWSATMLMKRWGESTTQSTYATDSFCLAWDALEVPWPFVWCACWPLGESTASQLYEVFLRCPYPRLLWFAIGAWPVARWRHVVLTARIATSCVPSNSHDSNYAVTPHIQHYLLLYSQPLQYHYPLTAQSLGCSLFYHTQHAHVTHYALLSSCALYNTCNATIFCAAQAKPTLSSYS